MKLEYLLLSEGSTIDQNNKVSLINIFDHLISKEFPFVAPKLVLSFSAIGDQDELPDRIDLKIQITNPDDKTILELLATGEKEDDKSQDKRLKLSSVLSLDNKIKFKKPGTYKYKLFLENELIGEKDLVILRSEEE